MFTHMQRHIYRAFQTDSQNTDTYKHKHTDMETQTHKQYALAHIETQRGTDTSALVSLVSSQGSPEIEHSASLALVGGSPHC